MSVLTDEDQEVDRQPSLTTKRAPISRRIKQAEPAEPPLESIARSRSHPAKTDTDFERLFTPKEASQLLRLSLSWLAKSRVAGLGPTFVKLGRSVRYREKDLVQWLKSRARQSTSER